MPELVDDKNVFSLLEVAGSIQKTIAARYTSQFWVKAEMNKLNHYPHSGHCYPDLVEKFNGKVIAQLKSTLWKDDFNRINENFLNVVKTPLKDGIKMLFCARITFDPLHGLALRIVDIDPVFSLGELEREKQESISRLKKEGIFDRNRSLVFPLLPKRMAIISVQTSKGYADFLKMIDGNPWGYRFSHTLFPSLLQGDRAVESILVQLDKVRRVSDHFDVVAIIRGGGGDVGLSCFNHYRLSKEIALFPLPVITGIGHATNETVVEMVAYRNAITPTELADFLLQKFHNFSVPLKRAEEVLVSKTRAIIAEERQRLQHTVRYFRSVTDNVLSRSGHEMQQTVRDLFRQSNQTLFRERQATTSGIEKIRNFSLSMCNARKQQIAQNMLMIKKDVATFFRQENSILSNVLKTVGNMHPDNVLKRGYSITRLNGKAVNRVDQVQSSDTVETSLADGIFLSEVKSKNKHPAHE
jgi:exodeoxyribonuclease VII large subunit